MTQISELLKIQAAQVAAENTDSELATALAISKHNSTKIADITSAMEKVLVESKAINPQVWVEYSFGNTTGAVLGFLRTCFLNMKQRNMLCRASGISPVFVDMYYKYAGSSPYIKNGEIVEAKPMDVIATRKLVRAVATELEIIITDSDLELISEESVARRNELATERANDWLNIHVNQSVTINEVQSFEDMLKNM